VDWDPHDVQTPSLVHLGKLRPGTHLVAVRPAVGGVPEEGERAHEQPVRAHEQAGLRLVRTLATLRQEGQLAGRVGAAGQQAQ